MSEARRATRDGVARIANEATSRLEAAWTSRPYSTRLGVIVAGAAIFRLAFLDRQPLWRDEAFTAVVARMPLGDLLAAVGRDSAPPVFYLLEHLVVQVGDAPWLLRLVPALAGIVLVSLVAALARRIRGDAAGLWAAAFVAVLPAALYFSRDARMYGPAACLVAASMILLWRALDVPSPGRWAAYTLAAALAVWTVYFAALAVAATLAASMLALRPSRRVVLLAAACTAAAFASLAPWFAFASGQLGHVGSGFWVPPATPPDLAIVTGQLVTGPAIDAGIPFRTGLQVLQVLAFASGALAFVGLAAAWGQLGAEARRRAILCLAASIGGLAVISLASFWRSLLEERYASVLWVPIFALAGVGLATLPRRLAAAALLGLAVPGLALSTTITHPETNLLVPRIEAQLGGTDFVDASTTQYLILLQEGGPTLRAHLHVVGHDIPWFWGTVAYPPGAIVPVVPASVVESGGRILSVREPEDPAPLLPPGYRETDRACVVRVCLTVFSPSGR